MASTSLLRHAARNETPHERGYNPSDQRHNLTLAGTLTLPWSMEASAVAKLISGSPIKVQAGLDLPTDGDGVITGDLPVDIPSLWGGKRVDESPRGDRRLSRLAEICHRSIRRSSSWTLTGPSICG
jgi:hypothetical protein